MGNLVKHLIRKLGEYLIYFNLKYMVDEMKPKVTILSNQKKKKKKDRKFLIDKINK